VSVTRRCAAECLTVTRAIPCKSTGCRLRCRSRVGRPPSRSRRVARTAPRAFYHLAHRPPRPLPRSSGRSTGMCIFRIASVPLVLLHAMPRRRLLRVCAHKSGRNRRADGCEGSACRLWATLSPLRLRRWGHLVGGALDLRRWPHSATQTGAL